MRNLFLNLTAHKLTSEQLEEAQNVLNADVVDLSEYKSENNAINQAIEEIVPKLRNSPSDEWELYGVADYLLDIIREIAFENSNSNRKIFIHFPVGSPAQMWYVALMWEERLKFLGRVFPVFSHTERNIVEKVNMDGTVQKVSVFKFKKFILPFYK